jgi:hypothetical protein
MGRARSGTQSSASITIAADAGPLQPQPAHQLAVLPDAEARDHAQLGRVAHDRGRSGAREQGQGRGDVALARLVEQHEVEQARHGRDPRRGRQGADGPHPAPPQHGARGLLGHVGGAAKRAAAMRATRCGDPPGRDEIDMGPIVERAGLRKIDGLVRRAPAGGAEALVGGRPAARGAGGHDEPTAPVDVGQDMDVARKEIFAPVPPVMDVDGLDEAIALANDTTDGPTSSIFTRGVGAALRACDEPRFGETCANRENFEATQGIHAGRGRGGIGGADGEHARH